MPSLRSQGVIEGRFAGDAGDAWGSCGLYGGGVDGEDAVAREIGGIESEQGWDAVDEHKGGKAGVIDLNAGDAVRDNKASPLLMYGRNVVE